MLQTPKSTAARFDPELACDRPEALPEGPFARILVPVDGSARSEQAIPAALSVARRTGGGIDLVWVHAEGSERITDWGLPEAPTWMRGYLEVVAEQVTDRLGAPVCRRILKGRPAQSLLRHAHERDVDLIVMATHGRGPLSRAWLGSTTDSLIRSTHIPVLVLRPLDDREPDLDRHVALREIVVALDGSPEAESVLEHALALARTTGGALTLLRIVEPPILPTSSYIPHAAALNREALERETAEAERYLERTARWLHSEGVEVRVAVREATGAADGILRYARESRADVIALGTHGRGRASRMLLGSAADKVLRAADVPVLLVNGREST